jgi:hypothetical protein
VSVPIGYNFWDAVAVVAVVAAEDQGEADALPVVEIVNPVTVVVPAEIPPQSRTIVMARILRMTKFRFKPEKQ